MLSSFSCFQLLLAGILIEAGVPGGSACGSTSTRLSLSRTRVGRQPLGERRRRPAVGQPVLIAVPGAGDAAVDDAAFAQWAVLMRAGIAQRADLVAVAEHGDPLAAGRKHDACGAVRNVARRSDHDPAPGG
jgi:hypothetical protein